MPTDAEVLTLHRYYIWANKFRTHFDQILGSAETLDPNPRVWFFDEAGLFLSYWYAALYVVIEGWLELGLQDEEIDALLASPNVDHLRRYRNGVCHFQSKYFDERFVELMASPGSAEWVRSLNYELGRFFLQRPHS
jgi:hypothetical protein